MLPKHAKLHERDKPIEELVAAINDLPFIDTLSVCAGHLGARPYSKRFVIVPSGLFLSEGWLSFQADDRYAIIPDFIEGIKSSIRPYPFAVLEQHENAPDDLNRYIRDFRRYSSHFFSVYARGGKFTCEAEARERLERFYSLWKDMASFCRAF